MIAFGGQVRAGDGFRGERELRARALAISLSGLLAEYALAHRHDPGGLSALLPEAAGGLSRALSG